MKQLRILIAPDSMKECLDAVKVAQAIESGVRKRLPDSSIDICPMADGGEGTTAILSALSGAETIQIQVSDPLGRSVEAAFAFDHINRTAYVELASASGLHLLKPEERNPALTSTFGTGELIKEAIIRGASTIVLGLGGSATNDAGTGLIRALGIELKNKNQHPLLHGGMDLLHLTEFDTHKQMEQTRNVKFIIASDVSNRLTGRSGASYVYGPQKGAGEQMVTELDKALLHFAACIKQYNGKDILPIAGMGAGGGTAAALSAFFDVQLVPGFDLVAGAASLERRTEEADIVITAEGKLDAQSLNGKVPFGIATLCQKYQKPCFVLSGTVEDGAEKLYAHGVTFMSSIQEGAMSKDDSMAQAAFLLEKKAFHLAGLFPLVIQK